MPVETIKAVRDPQLKAQIVRRMPLVYREGPSESADRPPFVLAASGLSTHGEFLFVVQDNANWIAVVHPDETVTGVPLPRGPGGVRVFSKDRDNAEEKADLEACVAIDGEDGPELVAFGSGTGPNRCWILHVTGADRLAKEDSGADANAQAHFLDARGFYDRLRSNGDFSGGEVNIEGAVALDNDRIVLFQRGNSAPGDGEPVDSIAHISWRALKAHLDSAGSVAPPDVEDVVRYELGEFEGVRLTFSDAEKLGGERLLYSASAENSSSGKVVGSVLGVIEADRSARWTEIADEDGKTFASKIEGLTFPPARCGTVRFVIDDDNETAPSEIYEAVLSGGFEPLDPE